MVRNKKKKEKKWNCNDFFYFEKKKKNTTYYCLVEIFILYIKQPFFVFYKITSFYSLSKENFKSEAMYIKTVNTGLIWQTYKIHILYVLSLKMWLNMFKIVKYNKYV